MQNSLVLGWREDYRERARARLRVNDSHTQECSVHDLQAMLHAHAPRADTRVALALNPRPTRNNGLRRRVALLEQQEDVAHARLAILCNEADVAKHEQVHRQS